MKKNGGRRTSVIRACPMFEFPQHGPCLGLENVGEKGLGILRCYPARHAQVLHVASGNEHKSMRASPRSKIIGLICQLNQRNGTIL